MTTTDRISPQQPGSPPAVSVDEITDPTPANDAIEVLQQDVVQLDSQRLRARRVTVRLEGALIVFHRTNLRVRTRTSVNRGLVAYGACGSRAEGSANGLPMRSGTMLAVQPGTEVVFVAEPGYESVFALLAPEEIELHLRGRQRDDDFRMPRGAETLHRDAASVRRFFAWGKRLIDTAVRRPALFDDRRETRVSAQAELLETLLAALGAATDFQPPRSDRARLAQSRIVKTAEDHALACVGDRLHVTDLCRATGVSERSLEYAFKEIMGMSPTSYLTRVRLHRARKALQAGTRASTTVSAEALNQGFWHFGEFSRAYRGCFGELPSETLRRTAAQVRASSQS
jgi:AraC family transcriptional regulator, ethanolamine operon transcriptional activator